MQWFFWPPPNHLNFRTHISCTNKARFPRFYIFLNLYCPLDWLIKTSVYTSRGIVKYFFSKFSFIDMFGTCWSPCKRKFGWFGGGGKNHLGSKTSLSKTKWSLRNSVIFSTTSKSPQLSHTWSLAQTKLGFQGLIYIFLFFLNLYCPLDWLIKTSIYTARGHCKIYFVQIFFHRHVWHMWVTV